MEIIPKLFVDRQHRFRKIVVDDMIIDFVCWLLRVNYGTLLMSSQHKRDYPGQRVDDGDGQNFQETEIFAWKNWFSVLPVSLHSLTLEALPRFEIFEICRARVEDNKIQRSDNPIIHHFAGCRIRSLKIMLCAEQKVSNFNFTSPRVHYFHPDGQRWVFIRPRHLGLISQSEAWSPLTLTNERPALVPCSLWRRTRDKDPGSPAIAECFRCPHYDTGVDAILSVNIFCEYFSHQIFPDWLTARGCLRVSCSDWLPSLRRSGSLSLFSLFSLRHDPSWPISVTPASSVSGSQETSKMGLLSRK